MTDPKKLFFTVGELAKMAGVSKLRMRGVLEANEVPIGKGGPTGRRGIVYVSSLTSALPELADSIRFKR